jgi:membrane protease YdiL (CAAX protease family)
LPESQPIQPARFSRTMQLALFVTSLVWYFAADIVAARSAHGIALRFGLLSEEPLLSSIFVLFLLALGFSMLQGLTRRPVLLREVLGLPQRATSLEEWGIGAAIGWGSIVLAVLPMALTHMLRVHFWTEPRAFWLLFVNLATLAVAALVEEVAFRGFPFRRLIAAIGPVKATIAMSILFGLLHALNPEATFVSVLVTMLAGVFLSLAWLRTHGLWLPWGLHFAWNASMGVLFGLPVSGLTRFSTVVETRAIGPVWVTGGSYGPEGGLVSALAILIGIVLVVRLTSDYAWNYTHPPIIAAGRPMDVAPPAAHTAMEEQAAKPPSLIQILPTTPQSQAIDDPNR